MAMPNLLDIAKANGSDALVGLIDETSRAHPEVALGYARPVKGINFKSLVRTALGRTTGSFRAANAGTTAIKGTYENRLFEASILEARWECDKAVADSHEDGAQAFIALEAQGVLEGEMQGLAAQFYYGTGTGGNADGYPGLLQAYDSTNMVVDAGGTTATTGSSCWLVRFGPQAVGWIWGNGGQLKLSDPRVESVVDSADSTKKFDAYVQTLFARPGLMINSAQSIARIKKLTADSGKGLTDALIAEALSKFPVGRGPTHIFCSRRSAMQLQKSRTVTIMAGAGGKPGGGTEAVAPLPDSAFGIPLLVTDALLNTEALTL